MTRLVTFGCSFTYGEELDELTDAWPNVLANFLNIDVKNEGKTGSSNLEILYKILNFNFQEDDIVVIMWTYYSRDYLFKTPTHQYSIGPWSKDINDLTAWVSLHTDHDLIMRSFINIHHAHSYLSLLNVKNYHTTVGIRKEQTYNPGSLPPSFFKFKLHSVEKILDRGGKLKRGHPDKLTHLLMAKEITILLKDMGFDKKQQKEYR